MQQEPFLVIKLIAGPIAVFKLLQFLTGRFQLPGIQVKVYTLQSVETLKSIPAVKDRKSADRRPGPIHQGLEGNMTDIGQSGFDSGQDFGGADSFRHLLLGESCLLSGFSDKSVGVVDSHISYSITI